MRTRISAHSHLRIRIFKAVPKVYREFRLCWGKRMHSTPQQMRPRHETSTGFMILAVRIELTRSNSASVWRIINTSAEATFHGMLIATTTILSIHGYEVVRRAVNPHHRRYVYLTPILSDEFQSEHCRRDLRRDCWSQRELPSLWSECLVRIDAGRVTIGPQRDAKCCCRKLRASHAQAPEVDDQRKIVDLPVAVVSIEKRPLLIHHALVRIIRKAVCGLTKGGSITEIDGGGDCGGSSAYAEIGHGSKGWSLGKSLRQISVEVIAAGNSTEVPSDRCHASPMKVPANYYCRPSLAQP